MKLLGLAVRAWRREHHDIGHRRAITVPLKRRLSVRPRGALTWHGWKPPLRSRDSATTSAEPEALFVGAEGAEAFEFARTASRLFEMRSADYLALPHGRDGSRSGDLAGLAET